MMPISSYLIDQHIVYLTITDKSYPRKLAFTYLTDIATEFSSTHPMSELMSPSLRPYAYMSFDTFIQRTKKTYQDTRATSNLDKLNDELKDVTKVMTKNIEDLLYRGDSLERMGDMSSRLRDESKKYRQAAVRINWEYMWKQVTPLHLSFWSRKLMHIELLVWALRHYWASNHYFSLVEILLEPPAVEMANRNGARQTSNVNRYPSKPWTAIHIIRNSPVIVIRLSAPSLYCGVSIMIIT